MAINLKEFIEYLESHVNKSIYVWGGQGETLDFLNEARIRAMETSKRNADRAIVLYNERKNIPGAMAFDCSGLGMYYLDNIHGYYGDMTSNDMKTLCKRIDRSELLPGDLVFKCYSSGKAYHVGYVVDMNKNVIQAKGRDDGVVKTPLSSDSWNYYGRPRWFEKEIEGSAPSVPPVTVGGRVLKRLSPNMRGDDVIEVQTKLVQLGYSVGAKGIDGAYGKSTEAAVKAFQLDNKLVPSGIVDAATHNALFGAKRQTLSRNLKRTIPNMTGDDVLAVQKLLISLGYYVGSKGADGAYGTNTASAVKKFQTDRKLKADGIVGRSTANALGIAYV